MRPDQVFVGNGSDKVLAQAFVALLKQDGPLLFPDITYGFYAAYCRLFGIHADTVPLDASLRIGIADYARPCGAIILPNPNAPTGIALGRAEIAALWEAHPDRPVVVNETYVDFGAETAIPLIPAWPNPCLAKPACRPGPCRSRGRCPAYASVTRSVVPG